MASEQPAGTKFSRESFHGQSVDLYVDANGTFRAIFEGEEYAERDIRALRKILTKATLVSEKRIAIPAHIVVDGHGDPNLRPIVLTGLHARNHQVLIRFEDDKKEADTISVWSDNHNVLVRLEKDEIMKRNKLQIDFDAAEKALQAFDKRHAFKNLKATIEKALKGQG